MTTTTEIMNLADTYADGPHTEGYYGAHRAALQSAIEALVRDAERIDFIQRYLFGHKWNGVIDSGSRTNWDIWSGYRHITTTMVGNTFREAIDAAIAAQEVKHED